jgi:GTP pyrophosphokinase
LALFLRYYEVGGMDINLLIAKASEYLPPDGVALVEAAYQFASQAHQGQLRISGEPYLEHPFQVALILAELQLDADTLAAALLHDVPEDCGIALNEIEANFGSEVAKLVAGITKLSRITGSAEETISKSKLQVENLRRMLVAMAEDLRVILIKLADRLHNMRTLGALPSGKRHAIAQETLELYAPLAHRLGMWEVKWQLEDMSFRYLEPRQYHYVARLVAGKRAERESFIEEASRILSEELNKANVEAKLFGRPKHIYSIYQKMSKYSAQGRDFSDIHDLLALRVLVNLVSDCYKALGVIHNLWHPISEEFNDFIANPKDNGYQSLHTTVIYQGGTPLEIQIRTYEMHKIAEYGVAAHWCYKEGGKPDASFGKGIAWLAQLGEWQQELDSEEFLESVRTDVLAGQVFVYTPKGEIKDLPKGSTPLDFAFRIHTELGYRCIGAKVNGRLVPLTYTLSNGDVVEIVAAKGDKGPSLDWLNPELGCIKTSHARTKIRQWFRKQERGQNIEMGKELLDKEIRRLGLTLPAIEEVASLFDYRSSEDFFAALGCGNITPSQVALKLTATVTQPEEAIEILPSRGVTPSSIKVLGIGDLLVRLASCCHPLPGDEIIGYITQGRGITVHRRDCVNIINEVEKERLIDVQWGEVEQVYPVTIQIDAWDRVGLLRDISAVIAGEGVNITEANMTNHDDSITSVRLSLEVSGVAQLSKVLAKINSLWNVINVVRKGEAVVKQ